MKLPVGICTEALFPDIHPDHIGRAMPDIIGHATLVGAKSDAPGAVEAVYTDTVNHEYLAAGGILYEIEEVYSNGVLKTLTTHYSVIYRDGRTYIRFTSNQGEKKITFNCLGYFVDPWNSVNGHIQNPAYVLAFFEAYLVGVPDSMLALSTFDDMAAVYDALGFGEAGKIIIQEQQDISAILKKALWSFGVRMWEANDGRITIGRKDISNFATSTFVFRQIDALDVPRRKTNWENAANRIQYQYDEIPTANSFKGSGEILSQPSIDANGELRTEWEFPCITSAAMALWRAQEELSKRAYGYATLEIRLALEWLDSLDIMSSFRFQDPFGLGVDGAGEYGRYFSIYAVEPDLENDSVLIKAEDLQWLLRQYCILGDEDSLAATWATAQEDSRMFCYLGDETTGEFSDGEPIKILIDENELGA